MTTPAKRSRPSSASSSPSSDSSMPELPEIPKIPADLVLELYTHKSIPCNEVAQSVNESGTNERLTEIGEKALELAATNGLYQRRPIVKAVNFEAERRKLLAPDRFETWVSQYQLRARLRHIQADVNSAEETRALFCAYVGAVFVSLGMGKVTEWLGQLLDPCNIPPNPDGQEPYFSRSDDAERANKRSRSESAAPPTYPPPPLPQPPPPPPQPPHGGLPYPNTHGQQQLLPPVLPPHSVPVAPANTAQATFTALFNMKCSQNRLSVEYQAEFVGPPHAGRWSIKCVVNGIVKGQGAGQTKQQAKEEAAKQAYYQMGFAAT